MTTLRCMCGDTDCPNCGTAQGTLTGALERDLEACEHLKKGPYLRLLARQRGDTRWPAALRVVQAVMEMKRCGMGHYLTDTVHDALREFEEEG